ncbi:MAG: hypothetical protein HY820_15670 [Acidobacteria bacterium]|nr:hypothetical protein [Acidobacteriota bacterium]
MANPVLQFQIISTEPDKTASFYSDLFGWTVDANNPMGYRQINTGSSEGITGGIWPAPPQAQNFVQLFVGVDNVAESLTQAQSLGAKVLIPATRLPDGDEMAVLKDPHGMPFAIYRASTPRR